MTADLIRYDLLVQDALRSVVKKVLGDAAKNGLPGEHHFNISFKTKGQGVVIPAAMRQKYPDEMAIILQHQFWDLTVANDGFEVSLSFAGKPERLSIPFNSITGFSDPSVPFGFKLEPKAQTDAQEAPKTPAPAASKVAKPATVAAKPAPKSAKAESGKTEENAGLGAEPAKVVSIDAFRKK